MGKEWCSRCNFNYYSPHEHGRIVQGIERDIPKQSRMPEKNTFWIIWSPQGHNPQYRHYTFQAAQEEGIRLGNLHPASNFFVMEMVRDSSWYNNKNNPRDEEVPF